MAESQLNYVNDFSQKSSVMRDGIVIEKGKIISTDWLEANEARLQDCMRHFMLYPDIYLDTIKAKNCPINFYFYQRVIMRAMMRYRYFYGTFTRATSKSFMGLLVEYLKCIFMPRSKRFLVSQFKKASLDITRQKLDEIWTYYPMLKNELSDYKMSTDYIELEFKNGSIFQILTLSASSRGQRASGGIMEECAMIDGQTLSAVIIPMMNVPRLSLGGGINPTEPHAQQIYITSAGTKTSFAYERLIELLENECLHPDDYFVCGAAYNLPLKFGLFDKKNMEDQKNSTSMSSEDFARESLSIWTGTDQDSWFSVDKLLATRSLLKCARENPIKPEKQNDEFIYISMDVGRTGNNDSAIMVIHVVKRPGTWLKKVVYTENLTKMSLVKQSIRLKELIAIYNPREVLIDANGIGTGVVDNMIIPSVGFHGEVLPAYYVNNDPDTYPIPYGKKDQAIIYSMKANAQINNDMYSNLYVQFNSNNVKLLANDKVVREKLQATKKGALMTRYQKEKFLLPYVMTSRLIDEMSNLRLKPTGVANQITVEQITKRINKDRVSALGYGLYRIKYFEDNEARRRERNFNGEAPIFYSSKRNQRRGDK